MDIRTNSLHKNSGSTLPEVLIAAAVVMVVALGIGGAFAYFKLFDTRNRMESLQLSLESKIILGLQTGANFSAADIANLQLGNNPIGLTILDSAGGGAIAKDGTTLYFDTNGNATTPGAGNDALTTDLSVTCIPPSGSVIYAACFAAYRIAQNPTYAHKVENLVPVGSYGPGWLASDYMSVIPYTVYMHTGTPLSTCPAGTSVGAMGFNTTTASITCLQKPSVPCDPHGGFAIGYTVAALSGPVYYGELDFSCLKFRQVHCATPGYVVQTFQMSSLDPRSGAGVNATCVLETMHTVGWEDSSGNPRTIGPDASIPSTPVCPINYTTTANPCVLTNIIAANVHCPDGTWRFPVPGSCWRTVNPANQEVTAGVTIPPQPSCPTGETAIWFAEVQLTGSCTAVTDTIPGT